MILPSKIAAIAWELEKTTVLSALEQEFANNKLQREWDQALLEQLVITTNFRSPLLWRQRPRLISR